MDRLNPGTAPGVRAAYVALAQRMGVFERIHPSSRFYSAFRLLDEWGSTLGDRDRLSRFVDQENANNTIGMAAQEIFELSRIIPELRFDDPIAARKFLKASDGTLNVADEQNTEPRNTQFELALYADIRRANLDARLTDPNPDISVLCGPRIYHIECKRMSSPTSLDKNVSVAARQLRNFLQTRQLNEYGVIALSVDAAVTEQNAYLDAPSPRAAARRFESDFTNLVSSNAQSWMKPSRLMGNRIPAVIICRSITSITHAGGRPKRTVNSLIAGTNTALDSDEFRNFADDFRDMF